MAGIDLSKYMNGGGTPAAKIDVSKYMNGPPPLTKDPEATPNAQPTMGGYVSKYDKQIQEAAKHTGVNPNVLRAMHFNEDSQDDPNAISTSGAIGEDQMKPETFAQYADKGWNITNPGQNIEASARYIKDLTKQYKGDMFKVYAAYNAGHYDPQVGADVVAYAKRAQANLEYLESRGNNAAAAPTAAAPAFKKGGAPPSIVPKHDDTRNAAQKAVGAVGDKAQEGVEAGADFVDSLGEKGAVTASQLSKFVGSTAWKAMKPEDQQRLQALAHSDLSKVALGSVGWVAQAVALVPSLGEAALRGNDDMGEFGKGFMAAMRDPKASRQIMSALNARYYPLGPQDQAYWVTKPGLFTKQGAESVTNPLALASSLYATVSQQLYTMPHARDLLAFAIGWYNPANRVPGVILGLGGKAAKVAVDKATSAPGKAGEVARGAKEKYTGIVTQIPGGDRFYGTRVARGPEGEAEHRNLARRTSASHGAMTNLFTQPDKGGGGIVPGKDDHTMYLYHDKMYNASNTAHMHAPNAGDTLTVDPRTKALTMRRGPKMDTSGYDEHLQYAHVFSSVKPHEITNFGDLFQTGATGPHFKNFVKHMKSGDLTQALLQHHGANPAEVQALDAHITQMAQGLPPRDAAQLRAAAAKSYIGGIESRRLSSGGQTVPVFFRDAHEPGKPVPDKWQGTIVYGHDQNNLTRDHTPMGSSGTTLDARVYYTAMASHANDEALRTRAPKMAKNLVDGLWSRAGTPISPGLFENEVDPQIPETLGAARAGGGGLMATTGRKYDTVDEGIAAGQQMNPKFSPFASIIHRATKADQLIKYLDYLGPHLEEIDYEDAMKGIVMKPEVAPGTKAPVWTGVQGKAEMHKAVAQQAEKTIAKKYGNTWLERKDTDAGKQEITNEAARLMKQIEAQFRSNNPGKTWNTEDHTGVDDYEGHMLPEQIVKEAQDSHPGFEKQKGRAALLGGNSDPEKLIVQGLDVMSGITRDGFMSVLPYHPVRNIANIAFVWGHVNPLEIAQAFVAPDTIDPALFKEIEDHGLTAQQRGGAGMPLTALQHRQAMDAKYAGAPNRNQYQNIAEIPKRIKAVMDAHKRVAEGKQGLAPPTYWGMLQTVYYHGDKYASDTVFGLHEDALTALTYNKFKRKGYSPNAAAAETRKLFGDRENATKYERFLAQHLWFYNWFKTQMRNGVKLAYAKRSLAMQGGVNAAVASQSAQNQDPDTARAVQYGEVQRDPDKDGNVSSVQVTPPAMGYLGAGQQLIEGAVGALSGDPAQLMDFGQYIKSHIEGQLDPRFRPFFDYSAHNTWDLGPNNPTIPKSANQSVFHDDVIATSKVATPSLAPYLQQVAEDPVTYFPELLGNRVSVYNPGALHVARKAMVDLWRGKGKHGGFEGYYYAAGNDPQKQQQALKAYEAAAAPYIKILESAKSAP